MKYLALFMATVVASNYMIKYVGICSDIPPCLIYVWPGILAPSGVLTAGLSFILRDLAQEHAGSKKTAAGILVSAVISALMSINLAVASFSAFAVSEFLDMAVYTPLKRKNLALAVILSNVVGLFADSVIFLFLAFHSLEFLPGQVIGKMWMTVIFVPLIILIDKRRSRTKGGK